MNNSDERASAARNSIILTMAGKREGDFAEFDRDDIEAAFGHHLIERARHEPVSINRAGIKVRIFPLADHGGKMLVWRANTGGKK